MAYCELCGSETQTLTNAIIAGSNMKICKNCLPHGKVVDSGPGSHNFYKKKRNSDAAEELVSDYIKTIQRAMQKKGLNAHHLARATNIKESEVNQYLSNKIKPDINTAKRIEKYLEISILGEGGGGDNVINYNDVGNTSLTLGDLIEKQMKK